MFVAPLWFACVALQDPSGAPEPLVWTAPGLAGAGSSPIGNGRLGANVWVDATGNVHVLLARGDTFSEACRLLKVGEVALAFEPPLDLANGYRETLDPASGEWRLVCDGLELVLLIENERDVLRAFGTLDEERRVSVRDVGWRRAERRLSGGELPSSWTMRDAPESLAVVESGDIAPRLEGAIGWYHHNTHSVVPTTVAHQGLDAIAQVVGDPLLARTFGAVAVAPGFAPIDERTLQSTDACRYFDLALAAPAARQPNETDDADTRAAFPAAWLADAHALAAATADGFPFEAARAANRASWSAFWSRSWIVVDGDAPRHDVPASNHPLRLGRDSGGANVWNGRIAGASIAGRVASAQQIAELAAAPAPADAAPATLDLPDLAVPNLDGGFTLAAHVQRAPGQSDARIFDRLTAGGTDGFLFDTHPGSSLRLVVGARTVIARDALPDDGALHHVAATYDATSGRVCLYVDGVCVANDGPEPGAEAHSPVTRGYALQRYATACAGRGAFPIKFNGSNFTVPPGAAGQPDYDADWRRWGDCYWWQNTRLPYHAMLAAGDFELMEPLFDFHAAIAPVCRARAELYHGVSGLYFPETVNMFGCYSNGDYGWQRDGHAANEVLCPWWQWAWNQGPELVALMLDRNDFAPDLAFARDAIVPLARDVLAYFDTRFERDEHGRLVISPTQALETHWHGVVNDLPCVAGLADVLERLARLPADAATPADRELWLRLSAALPALPVQGDGDDARFAPAEVYDPSRQNVETPELHALFPFRRVALGSKDLVLAARAFERRHDRQDRGWTQDGIFAARLGLVDEARAQLASRAANSHPAYRFPATWGPNFDWLPDQCHGAQLMLLTQEMLVQSVGDRILLFPAWPREWDVDFKLHAAHGTVVHARLVGGEITLLDVEPAERRADVEVLLR